MVIWTTTPWTMPANVAVALNPALEYAWVECEGEVLFMAKDLLAQVGAVCHKDLSNILGTTLGKDMEFAECVHPFPEYNNRRSLVVMADYVTTEAGTGCVHTAPGHGDVDFETGLKYKLPILCPVDSQGKLTEEAGERFKGMFVFDANIPVLKYLAELNCLLGKENIKHQYAHCWRCKNPIIFRATSQWFASIDGFRDEALKSIEDVQWIPSWGQQRIHNMVSDRHDWCISRQRVWGVPIPVFYCDNCGEHLINEATIDSVANWFAMHGGLTLQRSCCRKALSARNAAASTSIRKATSWTYGSTAVLLTWLLPQSVRSCPGRLLCTSKAVTSIVAGSSPLC